MANIFNDMDNTKLIEKFVQGSNQLLANQEIRLENFGAISQLMSRNGELMGIMHLNDKPRLALVKTNSLYTEILEEQLVSQDFVLIGESKKAGYLEYKQYVTPAGYQLYYTDPAILWKKWWPTERFFNKQRFNMNILISMKDNWYPVQNILVHAGTFTIKTIAGQIAINKDEKILWIAQKNQPEIKENQEINGSLALTKGQETHVQTDSSIYDYSMNNQIHKTASLAPTTNNLIAEQPAVDLFIPQGNNEQQKSQPINRQLGDINHLQKLQQLIETINQQKKYIFNMEQKMIKAEHRATIAEQRLHQIQKLLQEKGIDLTEIYGQGIK